MAFYHDLIPCTYLFVEEMLTMHIFGRKCRLLVIYTAAFFSALLILSGTVILVPHLFFSAMLRLGLLLRYGKQYGGLLGFDAYFERTKSYITTAYVVEHSGTFEELYSIVKKSSERLYGSHYRFSSSVRSIFGYYYFLKNNVPLDDILIVNDNSNISTKDELISYLEDHCFHDWSNRKLWEVTLFNKPIMWNNDSKVYYPILIRYKHCLGDGIALSAFAQHFLLENVKSGVFEKVLRKSTKSRDILQTTNIGKVFLMGPQLEYTNLNAPATRRNLAVFVEEEPKYCEIIKFVSHRMECSFTDVITVTAVTSLTNYLKLEGVESRNLIVYNTSRPVGDNPESVLEGNSLGNDFTLEAFNLPWLKEETMLERLNRSKNVLKEGRKSANGQIVYLLSNILSFLHPALISKFAKYNSIGTTLGITNIPFVDYGTIGGCTVKDTFLFVNHFEYTKFVLIVYSYGGRLQATLTTGKDLKTTRTELQFILDNIFLNIAKLYEEVKLCVD